MANMPRFPGGFDQGVQKATGSGTNADPWIPEVLAGGGGGGGGAVTIADGDDVAEGARADVPVDVVEDATARTGISLWKGIKNYLRLMSGMVLGAGSASIGGTKDNGPHWASVFGVSGARYTSADRSGSAASVTDAPAGGQKLVVTDVLISVDTAMRVDLREETSGTVIESFYLPANGVCQWTPRSKTKLATADKKLQLQTSVAGNVACTVHYFSET